MLSPNTILQNRYRVVRELGHGGMGTVYEALDQRVNCIVALKETIAGNNDEARRAFEREASLLGNLRHSALPKVMDYFSEDDGDFLIMEFIPGYDLAELLDLRGNPFPQAQAMRWADELLKVLEYLHGQKPPILHRDIKPSNLKLTKQGEIFLLDFGLAKGSVGQMPTLATNRSVRGYTPVYASLEQIHGHGTDARSDLYSLAATLYHLLTGVAPIDAPSRFHAVEDDHPDSLQPIEKVNSQVSASVAAVIHSAMAINRKQRPASSTEMRKALRNAVEEDEQHAAEEEYRRAEETRKQREDDFGEAKAKDLSLPVIKSREPGKLANEEARELAPASAKTIPAPQQQPNPTMASPTAASPIDVLTQVAANPTPIIEASKPGVPLMPPEPSWKRLLPNSRLLKALTVGLILPAISIALLLMFFIQSVRIEDKSMLTRLHDGERIFFSRGVSKPERGDIVRFWLPDDPTKSPIKRIIGLPGETVEIREGSVFINGAKIEEPYLDPQLNDSHMSQPPRFVKPHYYYVLGDNRDNSSDSRIWGLVPENYIYGSALFRYWPLSSMSLISRDRNYGSIPTNPAN